MPSTHTRVLASTVLCQWSFLLSQYIYKYLLLECCVNTVSYFSELRSTCCHSAVAIMFLLSLHTLKYLLPQCCFNMVCDCRPTSASQVYIYIHMSMRFITLSMHLHFLSLLPQSCVNKVDYCLYVLYVNHRWHSSVTATMKLANIWLQKNRRRFDKTSVTNCS